MRKERLINLTKEKGMNNIMNSSVKRVMKNLKDNETINAFGEVVEKGAGDYGNHFHQLDLFKESIKEIGAHSSHSSHAYMLRPTHMSFYDYRSEGPPKMGTWSRVVLEASHVDNRIARARGCWVASDPRSLSISCNCFIVWIFSQSCCLH